MSGDSLCFAGLLRPTAVLALLSLTACGGGGGGGGGSSAPPPFLITLDRNSINADFVQGTAPAPITINASSTGEYNGPFFVAAVIEGMGIDPNIQLLINGTSAVITMSPRATLTQGVYIGRVILFACSDQACNNHIGGTPVAVSYIVRSLGIDQPADATIAVTPETTLPQLHGSAVVAGTGPEGASLNWLATVDVPWLTLPADAGALGTSVAFDVSPTLLGALQDGAEHIATITLT